MIAKAKGGSCAGALHAKPKEGRGSRQGRSSDATRKEVSVCVCVCLSMPWEASINHPNPTSLDRNEPKGYHADDCPVFRALALFSFVPFVCVCVLSPLLASRSKFMVCSFFCNKIIDTHTANKIQPFKIPINRQHIRAPKKTHNHGMSLCVCVYVSMWSIFLAPPPGSM